MKFCKTLEDLPLYAKIILALPFIDLIWVAYRLVKSIASSNLLGIIAAVAIAIIGIPLLWIVDIVFIVWKGNVWWFC